MKRLLKILLLIVAIPVLLCVAGVAGLAIKYYRVVGAGPGRLETPAKPGELGQWVDPFIGTGGYPWMCAHNFPGASRPFGMMRLSPETLSFVKDKRALSTSGYWYGDDRLLGFSHTRLSGTGATDGGHFLILPTVSHVSLEARKEGQYVRFSHGDEKAFPGYYGVRLPKSKVLVELTATQRVGIHRYTFDAGATPHLLLDVSNALGGHRSTEGVVQVSPEANEVTGSIRTFGSFGGRFGGLQVYFVARFSEAFEGYDVWQGESLLKGEAKATDDNVGVDLAFAPGGEAKTIEVRLAISHASAANARANLQAEAAGRSFDAVLEEAKSAWEERLGTIAIEGATDAQRRVFYTALYRALQMPTVFNDVNGEYKGFDNEIHRAEGFRYFTDMSLWDTFRNVHSLYALIAPQDQRDMVVSLVTMAKQGGWLPRWPSGHGYTNSMLGTPADMVVAETYLKGIRDFDVEAAYAAMRRTALEATPKGAAFSGREGVEHYLKYSYCPAEMMKEAVGRTLEFGWSDFAVANLAEALGRDEDVALFREHQTFYRNLWNPETQYFHPRNSDGTFVEAFDPLKLTYLDKTGELTNDYVEGSALQWRYAVPYDTEGLIALFDSPEHFADELNTFFVRCDADLGAPIPSAYYWHGNEPDIHAVYLFNDAGRPDLTQRWVRWLLDTRYDDSYVGLDGNDDAATLSVWYVFSALGFYPLAGSDMYWLGAPLFERAEVKLGEGTLEIVADNFAPDHLYVRSVSLNGTPLERTWIRHDEIARGGVLRFEMSKEPAATQ
ncbi:MAG: glycoside hydrolase family 92 protein [bacterium]|nr:glycoside hydrolase family 92 protein [bacterium]